MHPHICVCVCAHICDECMQVRQLAGSGDVLCASMHRKTAQGPRASVRAAPACPQALTHLLRNLQASLACNQALVREHCACRAVCMQWIMQRQGLHSSMHVHAYLLVTSCMPDELCAWSFGARPASLHEPVVCMRLMLSPFSSILPSGFRVLRFVETS